MFRSIPFVFLFLVVNTTIYSQQIYKRTLKLMGSRFDITVVAKDKIEADQFIDQGVSEITRIEKLISSWDKDSQTSNINNNAGIKPVKVNIELFDLIQRAIRISELTDGAFDISYASMDNIWKFDGSMKEMPSQDKITSSIKKVGYKNIVLDRENATVFLAKKDMKIGFGAIGKGYAADKAKELLINLGVEAGIINASGDMNTWGKQPDNTDWKVAITNPLNKENAFALLPVVNSAVVTSGSYEKYVILNHKRYSHIIDPRTGYPSKGIVSVSVFAPKAELADALATSIFVMGIEVGLNRINQLAGVESIIVDDKGDVHTSNNIKIDK
ncbi:FAD:protein FMN transferase [Aquimarina sp. AU474]|uniref:FAD:protein FMN transferase n=1 Tax=Aquimarina sp. AU474 TaxID=2108529 RepID=UPI00351AA42C